MSFTSYAQNHEDVILHRVFGGQGTGFYVDVGAFHPVNGSVTKAFYDRGWSGINIEPGSIFDLLAAERPRDINLRMAVLDRSGTVPLFEDEADAGMSRVVDDAEAAGQSAVHMVPCDTLEAILRTHGQNRPVDFLKVDAEGAEGAIVGSTDWRSFRPRVLVFEATLPWSNVLCNQQWEPLLLEQGYVRSYFDGINCYYVPEEQMPLLGHYFNVPVNVLDRVIRYDAQAVAEREQARASVAEAAADRDRARAELATAEAEGEQARASLAIMETEFAQVRASLAMIQSERDQARAALVAVETDLTQIRASLTAAQTERDQALGDARTARQEEAHLRAELASAQAEHASLLSTIQALQAPVAMPDILPSEAAPVPPPARRHRSARAAARLIYSMVRPVARPVAHRLRTFLTGPQQDAIGALRHDLIGTLERDLVGKLKYDLAGVSRELLESRRESQEVRQELLALRTMLESLGAQMRAPAPALSESDKAELRRLATEAERAVLTLAMEAARPPASPHDLHSIPALSPAGQTTPAHHSPAPSRTTRTSLLLPRGRRVEIEAASSDLSIGGALIASHGDWEPHVRAYLEAHVQPDWVCLDIGANLGIHTLSLATLASEGRVIAFEADPSNFALLTRNLVALSPPKGRIDPVQLALWDSATKLTIGGADELAGCSFVTAGGINRDDTERQLRAVVDQAAIADIQLHPRMATVDAIRLDDWIAEHPLDRLDFIKLDVEGAEAHVLRGADRILQEHRPILLVEYNPACAAAYFGQAPDALFRELESRFTSISVIEPDASLTRLAGWESLQARLAQGKGWEDLICV